MLAKTSLFLAMPALAWSLTSCAGTWQDRTRTGLHMSHEAAKAASRIVEPFYANKCGDFAKGCQENSLESCLALEACQIQRGKINKAITATQFAISDGVAAVAIASEKTAMAALKRALDLIAEIHKQLKHFGILKEPKTGPEVTRFVDSE